MEDLGVQETHEPRVNCASWRGGACKVVHRYDIAHRFWGNGLVVFVPQLDHPVAVALARIADQDIIPPPKVLAGYNRRHAVATGRLDDSQKHHAGDHDFIIGIDEEGHVVFTNQFAEQRRDLGRGKLAPVDFEARFLAHQFVDHHAPAQRRPVRTKVQLPQLVYHFVIEVVLMDFGDIA